MPIELRYRTWFATLRVPADVQARLGRSVYRQTLRTDSKRLATQLAAPLVARWRAEIAEARDSRSSDAEAWREALRRAPPDDKDLVRDLIDDAATHVELRGGDAGEFHAEATGQRVTVLDHLDEYLASLTHLAGTTVDLRQGAIKRLAGRFRLVRDVTRPEVRRWVTDLSGSLTGPTIQRLLSDCRAYWQWLATMQIVPEDATPFDKLGLRVKKASWMQFTPAEVVALLIGASDGQLADLVLLAMFTGARREELCGLKVVDCEADRFHIRAAKTPSGVREVPLHTMLQPVVARLCASSRDGYVLSGLTTNRYGDRVRMALKRAQAILRTQKSVQNKSKAQPMRRGR